MHGGYTTIFSLLQGLPAPDGPMIAAVREWWNRPVTPVGSAAAASVPLSLLALAWSTRPG